MILVICEKCKKILNNNKSVYNTDYYLISFIYCEYCKNELMKHLSDYFNLTAKTKPTLKNRL